MWAREGEVWPVVASWHRQNPQGRPHIRNGTKGATHTCSHPHTSPHLSLQYSRGFHRDIFYSPLLKSSLILFQVLTSCVHEFHRYNAVSHTTGASALI